MKPASVNRLVWLAACLIAAVTFVVYLATGTSVGGVGAPVMPLDDVYIHFQYARQLANGQPYVYNPGLPPTSGATSLIYPFALAPGYLIGFQGLNLGIWAMLIGALAFAASILLVYHIGRVYAGDMLAALAALTFGLSGAFAWHAMSGMETMLAVCFSLALLYGLTTRRLGWLIGGGALLAITRPEGAIGAVLASLVILMRFQGAMDERVLSPQSPHRDGEGMNQRFRGGDDEPMLSWPRLALALIPLLAIGLQPLLNLLITGSATASGSQAKSLFSAALPMSDILARIVDNFVGMFRAWLLPQGEPVYLNLIVSGLALVGVLSTGYWVLRHTDAARFSSLVRRLIARLLAILLSPPVLIVIWLIGGALLISTLDTAFWHFRRYQMPFMALLFPLATWGAGWIAGQFSGEGGRSVGRPYTVRNGIALALLIVGAGLAASTWLPWLDYDALNVGYVRAQPLAMAQWLAANTPEDAVIAVHDVGMMRYVGGRTTFDIVGLTTPGAAAYWRQGPGAVGEFLARERPDYIANYGEGHGLGLGFLAQTDLYAEPLAEFTVDLDPRFNVALAAAKQGIYRPDWTGAEAATTEHQASLTPYLDGLTLIDTLNVADIADEDAHDYAWRNDRPVQGFPTEFEQFAALDCTADTPQVCTPMDGGRRINGEESFTLATRPSEDLLLVTRVHPAHTGAFDVYANDQRIATRVIPFLPGSWLEIATLIPADVITSERTRIRIVPHLADGDYVPYRHWAWQGTYDPTVVSEDAAQVVYQAGAFELQAVDLTVAGNALSARMDWATGGTASGDWIAFIHLYPVGDETRVVAQTDRRPGDGTLPPGDWLPGGLSDTFAVDLTGVPAGRYEVATGFYDPVTFERLMPTLTDAAPSAYRITDDGRLFVGTIEVEDTSS
ncbi:MAG: hypothetical protein IT320_20725 [Anaerolineae bacterium]|nr:hypothetical protein [Anaerolineae bacterium]